MSNNFLVKQSLELIAGYNFKEPLHHYLKQQFRLRKQMGARDRKWMREIIYAWFRSGNSLNFLPAENKLIASFFLAHHHSDKLAEKMFSGQNIFSAEQLALSLSEKLEVVKAVVPEFTIENLFPLKQFISPLLNKDLFLKSFFKQPEVWLRVKPGFMKAVTDEFSDLNIYFKTLAEFPEAIAILSSTAVHETNSYLKGLVEIQDLSSQRTGEFFKPSAGEKWYDCCAASGGKSLLLKSLENNVDLTVSDSRSSILFNLNERFKKAGITGFASITADLENGIPEQLQNTQFDGVIADVPCTGSGTWARNPEQMQSFNESVLDLYTTKQRKILKTIAPLVKRGKVLIYITCSVFEKENEAAVQYAISELNFKLESMQLIQGMEYNSDVLFVARLIK